ncbi:DUF5995 family protein [Streptomyces polychromogenes]|uniref:DUF5995 family protein n=1 Tax=Streptomyces polychromogenes TaxID=67342 RepID=A0ABP3EQ79_9ACTN
MRITTENINWRPRTAPEALEALELLTERLREAGDDRAVFLDVYVVITRRVVEVLLTEDHDGFLEPGWLSEVTGLFAEEALIATRNSLHGTPVTATSWRLATCYAAHGPAAPYRSAILGINAHINHDLGLVVHAYLQANRTHIDQHLLRRYRHDYFRVNRILEQSVLECTDMLAERYRCRTTTVLRRLPAGRRASVRLTMLVLVAWRDRIWRDILALWNAPDAPARTHITRRMERRAGRIARLIVTVPSSWRGHTTARPRPRHR